MARVRWRVKNSVETWTNSVRVRLTTDNDAGVSIGPLASRTILSSINGDPALLGNREVASA